MAVPETSPLPKPRLSASRLWPIRLLFGLEAAAFALFLPRIPDVKLALGLGEAALGTALAGIPAGTLVGLLVAPATVRMAGLAAASWLSVAALAWLFALPAMAASQTTLFLAFLACGVGISHTEIALNSLAGHVEAGDGRRIMSQCHGFWSIGSMCGALAGGWMAETGVAVLHQSLAAGVALTACVLALARFLPAPARKAEPTRSGFARPSLSILPLCLLPVGIMVIEGVFMDWSAVYLRAAIDAAPFQASLGFAVFATAMAAVRLVGDRLVRRFGERRVVLSSNLAAGAGTAVFAAAPTLETSLAGAVLAGAGVAIVYPAVLSAAARAPGLPERNIASVSFTSFVILLGSPAVFGLLAQTLGYREAVALCAALALPPLLLTTSLQDKDEPMRRHERTA